MPMFWNMVFKVKSLEFIFNQPNSSKNTLNRGWYGKDYFGIFRLAELY